MSRQRTLHLCVVAAFSVFAGACDGESKTYAPMFESLGDAQVLQAKCPSDIKEFRIGPNGLTESDLASELSVRIEKADFPPVQSYNDWTIVIEDQAGEPIPSARISWACGWMAVHGHGSNPRSIEKVKDGVFELGQQNFAMDGPWVVDLWIDTTGNGPEYKPQNGTQIAAGNECRPTNGAPARFNIQFKFCVPDVRGGTE